MLRRSRNVERCNDDAERTSERAPTRLEQGKANANAILWKVPLALLLFFSIGVLMGKKLFKKTNVSNTNTVSMERMSNMSRMIATANQHLFGCDKANATTPCHLFSPLHFFSQPSRQHYLDTLPNMGGDLPNLPRMTHISWCHPIHNTSTLPCEFTFLHLRKTGGTTIHHALGHYAAYLKQNKNMRVKVKRFTTCRGVLRAKCLQDAQRHLQRISHQLQHSTSVSRQHVVFAMVRDPISRFVSAMGQAMHVQTGSAMLRTKCLDETSIHTTLECVLDHLQEYGLKSDVHFVPMAVNLHALTRGQDVTISLYSQEVFLKEVLKYFGASDIYMRNRNRQEYLQSPLLSKLSVQDLSRNEVRIICQLYAVDVELMAFLGINVLQCSENTT